MIGYLLIIFKLFAKHIKYNRSLLHNVLRQTHQPADLPAWFVDIVGDFWPVIVGMAGRGQVRPYSAVRMTCTNGSVLLCIAGLTGCDTAVVYFIDDYLAIIKKIIKIK